MKDRLYRLLLNDKIINVAILLNVTSIILEEYDIIHPIVKIIGYTTLLFFIGEMVCKQAKNGILNYWKDGWNILDGTLVIISLPTLVNLFFPQLFTNSSVILVLRIFRVFRFFRLFHFLDNFNTIIKNFRKALIDTQGVMIGYFVVLVICALMSCSIFGDMAPQFFGTPGDALYSTFRLFTTEGWYEIPDALTTQMSPISGAMTRLFFGMILLSGGIFGLSLINSIFVDAMVSDNNDDIKEEIVKLREEISNLKKEIEKKH